MNHLAKWSDSLSHGVWLFVRVKYLNRVWIELVVSHGVGPLTLALIHLITDKPDWKCCRLLSCQWKRIWHTCTHLLCTQQTHWLSHFLFLSHSLLIAGLHKLSNVAFINKHTSSLVLHTLSSTNKIETNSFSSFHHSLFYLLSLYISFYILLYL